VRSAGGGRGVATSEQRQLMETNPSPEGRGRGGGGGGVDPTRDYSMSCRPPRNARYRRFRACRALSPQVPPTCFRRAGAAPTRACVQRVASPLRPAWLSFASTFPNLYQRSTLALTPFGDGQSESILGLTPDAHSTGRGRRSRQTNQTVAVKQPTTRQKRAKQRKKPGHSGSKVLPKPA
jgi:hypothetical protein